MTSFVTRPRRFWFSLCLALVAGPNLRADDAVRLRETFAPGYRYHVSTRVELSGTLSVPTKPGEAGKTLPVTGESAIEYDERVLHTETDGSVQKTTRIYRRVDMQRKVGDRPQQNTLRPAVRRLVVLRHNHAEVPFSPDGPLTWNEIDLVRTDVFTPALTGLLPDKPVRPGDRWPAARPAIQELTDLEKIEEGQLDCTLESVTPLEGRRHARVAFAGAVRGVNEDGPNRQRLEGYLYFDLESNHLSYLYLKGTNELLDKDGKSLGKVEGRFVLTRQLDPRADDLGEDAWRGIVIEPNAENTLLLYDNPEFGVRLLYPRRWRVAGSRGRQLALDEATGSGLLITLESAASCPTGAGFRDEVRRWLTQQKGTVVREEPVRWLQGRPRPVEQFAFETDLAGQRVVLRYYAVRQDAGGATVAARLLPRELAAVQEEADRIVRSLEITRPVRDGGKK